MPSSLVLYYRRRGAHIHVRVFSGTEESRRALNGVLVAFFREAMQASLVEFREEF